MCSITLYSRIMISALRGKSGSRYKNDVSGPYAINNRIKALDRGIGPYEVLEDANYSPWELHVLTNVWCIIKLPYQKNNKSNRLRKNFHLTVKQKCGRNRLESVYEHNLISRFNTNGNQTWNNKQRRWSLFTSRHWDVGRSFPFHEHNYKPKG